MGWGEVSHKAEEEIGAQLVEEYSIPLCQLCLPKGSGEPPKGFEVKE